jgi:hypothetical protein
MVDRLGGLQPTCGTRALRAARCDHRYPARVRITAKPAVQARLSFLSMNGRIRNVPSASVTGSAPFQVSSRKQPRWAASGPLTVPEANRSPVRREAPLTVMCASCWAAVQYIWEKGGLEIRCPLSRTSRRRSRPQGCVPRRYGSGARHGHESSIDAVCPPHVELLDRGGEVAFPCRKLALLALDLLLAPLDLLEPVVAGGGREGERGEQGHQQGDGPEPTEVCPARPHPINPS